MRDFRVAQAKTTNKPPQLYVGKEKLKLHQKEKNNLCSLTNTKPVQNRGTKKMAAHPYQDTSLLV